MSSHKPFVVACIPAYNEEKTIAKVLLKTKKYVDKVIVCDDGSTDMTAEIAEALGAEVIRRIWVTVLPLGRCLGELGRLGPM
jgi:glycosyltransferase involved in cell wall biosynthesis